MVTPCAASASPIRPVQAAASKDLMVSICMKAIQWTGRTGSYLQMNQLSLRNNRLKFMTLGKAPINFEEIIEYASNEIQ